MDEFLKMDVFFVVTTVAVVIVTALLSVGLWRIMRILKNLEQLSDMARDEGVQLREDIAEVRKRVKDEGLRALNVLELLGFTRAKRRKRKTESTEPTT